MSRPDETIELTPSGNALRERVAHVRAGAKLLTSVTARIAGVKYQFVNSGLDDLCREDSPTEAHLIDWITGPYCVSCSKALIATSYTEWSTSERREGLISERCPNCGVALNCGSASESLVLRRRVFDAFRSEIAPP